MTSSNPVAGAACVGAGVGPSAIDEVWGIAKAYATRVGAGPFPTELDDELGERIREAGGEFGTTTGRARRTGWLDLVALRYAARVNGLTGLVVTKLDVLTGIDPLNVAVRYRGPEGASFDEFPYHQSILHKARGEYVELPGWDEDITGVRSLEDLPANARAYLEYIERLPRDPDRDGGRRARPRRDDLDRRRRARCDPPPPELRSARRATSRPCRGARGSRRPRAARGSSTIVGIEKKKLPMKPKRRHLTTISRSNAEPKVELLAVVAHHADAERLLAPGLAVVRARRASSARARRRSPPRT